MHLNVRGHSATASNSTHSSNNTIACSVGSIQSSSSSPSSHSNSFRNLHSNNHLNNFNDNAHKNIRNIPVSITVTNSKGIDSTANNNKSKTFDNNNSNDTTMSSTITVYLAIEDHTSSGPSPSSSSPSSSPLPASAIRHETIEFDKSATPQQIYDLLSSAADINPSQANAVVLKLYNNHSAASLTTSPTLIAIGPQMPSNSPDRRYRLVVKPARNTSASNNAVAVSEAQGEFDKLVEAFSGNIPLLDDMSELRRKIAVFKDKLEQASKNIYDKKSSLNSYPALQKLSLLPSTVSASSKSSSSINFKTPSPEVLESLKEPSFNVWSYSDDELVYCMKHMFREFELMSTFGINPDVLDRFIQTIRVCYNDNPFHNFQHCFCVTQMCYCLLHVSGVHAKLSPLEKFSLIVSAIGHDLDHPGFNNAYQVNALTDLAIVYNDISPLENHHAAVLFTILRNTETNILSTLSEADFREARKIITTCILATDMAKHGDIMGQFRKAIENFNYSDSSHKSLLFQMIIKCSDISNETRPKAVSEPWVDKLLEEFFHQSDVEKAAGLPYAPFMDRAKVTKSSAQVGFIGFVMIPLFELFAKMFPTIEEPIIGPIRRAHDYYKSLLEQK